ncbi:MAG TPA: hypothetical protein VIK50_03710 [Gemmatimonadaceae bacterium]
MKRLIRIGTLSLLLFPLIGSSQGNTPVVPGARIRVTALGAVGAPRSGTVVTTAADTVVLRLDSGGETVPIPFSGISLLEVSRGFRRHGGDGAKVGFLVGSLTSLILSCPPGKGCDAPPGSWERLSIITGVLAVGGLGMIVGAAAGSTVKTDIWEALPSSRWQLSILPIARYRLALSLRF